MLRNVIFFGCTSRFLDQIEAKFLPPSTRGGLRLQINPSIMSLHQEGTPSEILEEQYITQYMKSELTL